MPFFRSWLMASSFKSVSMFVEANSHDLVGFKLSHTQVTSHELRLVENKDNREAARQTDRHSSSNRPPFSRSRILLVCLFLLFLKLTRDDKVKSDLSKPYSSIVNPRFKLCAIVNSS